MVVSTANSTVSSGSVFTKNVTVSGQVFIVTKGGENFKLGLVQVSIADSKAVDNYKKSLSDGINNDLTTEKASIDQAMPDYQAAKDKFDKALPDYTNVDSSLQSALTANGVQYLDTLGQVSGVTSAQAANIVKLDKQRADIGAKLTPLHNDLMTKATALNVLIDQQESALSGSTTSFIDAFPAQASTKTDADGKFTLSVPAGNTYVIVAKASRSVGEDTEYYKWIVPVDLTSANDGLSIMLSNDNLIDSVEGLSINASLIANNVPVDTSEIKTQPTSYTFKDSSYNDITPDSPTDMPTTTDTSTPPATPAPAAWTPPARACFQNDLSQSKTAAARTKLRKVRASFS